eukprot:TRINITY_DN23234_c0_g1_i1.p1 TRINITY_DN23234_c0_g1~~TRINITY_DN23234_c0_g1_i1.p1  ORF type:complete len:628 (-),score=136.43 TRINITY_DN23234_c0_g1_i1:211-2040(-)
MPLVCCGNKLPDVPNRVGGLQIPDVDIQVNSVGDVVDFLDVDKFSHRLDKVEAKLLSIVRAVMPEIKVELPKLDPDALGSDAMPGPVIAVCTDLAEDCAATGSREPLFTRATLAYGNEDEAMQLTAASEDAPAAAASRLEEGRPSRSEGGLKLRQDRINRLFVMPFVGAMMSAACAVVFAVVGAGAVFGPVLTAICAVLINSAAVAHAWRERVEPVFEVFNTQVAVVKNEILAVIEAVQPRLMTPLQELIATVDRLVEEQRPVLAKIQELQKSLDVDLPDLDVLKMPLKGCEELVVDLVGKAKKQIPMQIDALIDSKLAGRVISEKSLFDRYVIRLPLLALLGLNLAVAILQVMLSVDSDLQTTSAASLPTLRLLQDDVASLNSSSAEDAPQSAPAAFWNDSQYGEDPQYWMSSPVVPSLSTSSYTDEEDEEMDEDEDFDTTPEPFASPQDIEIATTPEPPASLQNDSFASLEQNIEPISTPEPSATLPNRTFASWEQNIEPVIVQVFLTLVQVAAAVVVSQGPRLCALANRGIDLLQKSVNEKLNDCLKEPVDQTFGIAFAEVDRSAKQVFPKLKEVLAQLKAALEAAAAAQKAAGGLGQLIDAAHDQ